MGVWDSQPSINTVYEAIVKLSRDGEAPVSERELLAELNKTGHNFSKKDLAKALMSLEIYGYIATRLSTKEEKLILLTRK